VRLLIAAAVGDLFATCDHDDGRGPLRNVAHRLTEAHGEWLLHEHEAMRWVTLSEACAPQRLVADLPVAQAGEVGVVWLASAYPSVTHATTTGNQRSASTV